MQLTYVEKYVEKKFDAVYPHPFRLSDTYLAPSAGTPVATVIAWGGDGASGGWLTWPLPGEAASKGSPAATDERCVLDEHIGPRPMPQSRKAGRQRVSGAAERARTEIAGGVRVRATY